MDSKKLSSVNLLSDLHTEMILLPKSFRESVCRECGWSEATFYRKTKTKRAFSNAEKDKIVAVGDNLLKTLLAHSSKYRSR